MLKQWPTFCQNLPSSDNFTKNITVRMSTLLRHMLPMIDEKYDEWRIFKKENRENIQTLMFCSVPQEERDKPKKIVLQVP